MKKKGTLGGIFAMALILALTFVLSVSSVSATEPTIVDSGNCGANGDNITWTLDDAGTLTISGEGEMADYESKTDSTSGEEITTAPWGNQAKTVVIEDGVTGIGAAAFYGCSGLTSVTIPDRVISIGYYAFNGCTGLTSVTIPDSVTSIGDYAFHDCTGLTSVTIPNSVTSIGGSAFSGCTGLKEVIYNAKAAADLTYNSLVFENAGTAADGMKVVFGESVEKIPSNIFSYCESLTSVTIPDSVTSIGDWAFSDCTGLKEVIYNAKAITDGSYAFKGAGTAAVGMEVIFGESVKEIPNDLFYDCAGLTSVTIPDSVTSIGDYAFNGCTGLTSVTIPDSVTSIGDYAFNGCTGLKEVIYNAKAADSGYNSNVFGNAGTASGGMKVVFGDSVEKIPDYLFDGCTGLTSVTIPNSVTSIGGFVFSGCTGLVSVEIPDSVTSLGDRVFSGCTGLTSVALGGSVTSIGNSAFYGCTGLSSVTMPDSVTSIENYAFYNCTGLTSVIIGSGVTSIESCAFSDCTGLTSVTIGSSVTSIGDSAFSGCTGLKEIIYNARAAECSEYNVFQNAGTAADGMKVVFGESVEKIPSNIFSNCESLTSVTIGSNVTSIGDYAFSYCESLTSVAIGSNVTSIGGYAFSYCKGLTSVTILDSVTSIGDYAFHGCTGLTSVTIPDSVISIGGSVFSGCKGLTSVTIGSNVTSIGGNAFDGCTGLKEVIYNAKAVTYNSHDFENAGTAADGMKVVFGESVEKIPAYLFYNCTGLTSVTIGKNVTSIGNKAFECSNLMEVNYNAKAITDSGCGGDVFLGAGESSSGIRAVIGDGVKKIPAGLFYETNIRSFVFTGNPPAVGAQALGYSNAYALYPVHNSEWTKSVREACGSHLTWIGYCTEPVSSAACRIDQTAYLPNDTLNTQGLCMTLTHKDGCTMTIPYDSGLLELGSCDMSTPGAKTIDVTYRGTTAQLKIYVHERKTQTLDKKGYPESSHNYENNLDKTYTYKAAGAVSLDVTFSAQTEVETNIDYLYVNGAQYTGTELAGKTISIQGDTLTIRLVSDKGDSAYGFSIDRIAKTYMEHQYKNGVCTLCGAKDPNFKLAAPTVKPSYVGASGKPYLRWNAVADASQYEVYRATTKNGTYTLLGTTTATNYTDNKAGSGYTYYYKVKALAANGAESDYSAVVAGICHCAKPTVKATYMGASGKPYIKWNAVANASKYEVYRATTKIGTYRLLGTTTATNYTDNKAGSGYTYYYKVRAISKVKSTANSVFSVPVAGICHCAKPTIKATYLGASGKPYIKWNAVANASKYEVYRATTKSGTYRLLGTTTATHYTDNKAGSGYTYYYKVRAISKVKSTANSVFSVPVAGICHCAKPTVKITTSAGKPKLTWNAVAGASQYEVYRATSKNGSYTKMFTTSNLSYTNTSAKAGTTYYYKVKAVSKVKSAANSAFSTVVSIRVR